MAVYMLRLQLTSIESRYSHLTTCCAEIRQSASAFLGACILRWNVSNGREVWRVNLDLLATMEQLLADPAMRWLLAGNWYTARTGHEFFRTILQYDILMGQKEGSNCNLIYQILYLLRYDSHE